MTSLAEAPIEPCHELPVLTRAEAMALLSRISDRWHVADDALSLECSARLATFDAAVALINEVARISDAIDHHPNICLKNATRVELQLKTFVHKALTINDFILAARLDPAIDAAQAG